MLREMLIFFWLALLAGCVSALPQPKTGASNHAGVAITITSARQEDEFLAVTGTVVNLRGNDLCFEGTELYPIQVGVVRISDGAELLMSNVVEEFNGVTWWAHASKDLSPWRVYTVSPGQVFSFLTYRQISGRDRFTTKVDSQNKILEDLSGTTSVNVFAGNFFSACKDISIARGFIEGPAEYVKSLDFRSVELIVE